MPKNTTKKPDTKTPAEDSSSPFKEISAIGEIVTSERNSIKLREVEIAGRTEKDKPRRVLDIRQFVQTEKYTGFGKGIAIPADQVEELRDFCDEYLALVANRKASKDKKKSKK